MLNGADERNESCRKTIVVVERVQLGVVVVKDMPKGGRLTGGC